MQLTKNFSEEEFCATSSKLPNKMGQSERIKASELLKYVVQPLRDLFGDAITISSGYRSIAVNKEKGGAEKPLSQHCKGEAVDLKSKNNALLFRLIRDNFMFDQLIWEGGDDNQPAWVHVSYKTQGNRGEILKMKTVNGKKEYSHIK